jgi:uncharacterized protein (DUF697 family)
MRTCRDEALRWVHYYAAGGAAFAAIPLPISTTNALAALETYLMRVVGDVYGSPPSGVVTAAAGGSFVIGGQALKHLAMQAACFVPVLGIPIRMTIAGATIELLGRAMVSHYETRYPDKVWSLAAATA